VALATNSWLLIDSGGKLSADKVRDEMLAIYPGVHTLVLELAGGKDAWSGFGFTDPAKNYFQWLHSNWKE
jgi:hypothetical protein